MYVCACQRTTFRSQFSLTCYGFGELNSDCQTSQQVALLAKHLDALAQFVSLVYEWL